MPEYLSPGVYVEEIEIGAKPIEGVSTSTAGFIGIAEKGPLNTPVLITSMGQFTEIFGDFIKDSYLAYCITGFFENGGKRCYVVRIAGEGNSKAYAEFENGNTPAEKVLEISALNEGKWGKNISVEIDYSPAGASFLYSSRLQEYVVSGNNYFIPTSTKGLAIGNKIKLDDGIQPSNELTVISFEDGKVFVDGDFSAGFSIATTRVMVVVTADAPVPASFTASLKSVKGFEKGDLVCFLEPGEAPVYVNLTDISFTENKITWEGVFTLEDGTSINSVEGAKFMEAKRVELEFTIVDDMPDDDRIRKNNIAEEDAIKSKIRPGDILTFGSGQTTETVTVINITSGSNPAIVFIPGLQYEHSANETFKALTTPQAKVFSKSLEGAVPIKFDIEVSGFRQNDILIFSGGPQGTDERTIVSVGGTEVELNETPTSGRTSVAMKFTVASEEVVIDSPEGFKLGDLVKVVSGNTTKILVIERIDANRLFLNDFLGVDNTDAEFIIKEWKTTTVNALAFGIKAVYEKGKKVVEETFNKLSLNTESSRYVEKDGIINNVSTLIKVKDIRATPGAMNSISELPALAKTSLNLGGSDGITSIKPKDLIGEDLGSGNRTGLVAFEAVDGINILCMPDIMSMYNKKFLTIDDVEVLQLAMISHCERMKDRFAVLDSIKGYGVTKIQGWKNDNLDSKYAALYYPWIKVMDPISAENGNSRLMAPSGHIAGIYARSDIERGVHKAPANEIVRGVIELEMQVTKGEQDILNPDGINCIRAFSGRGIRVWGARTISSDPLWKYVNIRRLFLFLEESIDEGTQWVVFEPNDEKLWARVRATITEFLNRVWREGALMGTKPEEAFFVKCDRTTMTQSDIDNGRLICIIGVAPVKPAEFVIFRIAQWTAGASGS